MSYDKLLRLIEKFSQLTSNPDNSDQFYLNFQDKLRSILNEMEGDLMSLKHKELNKDVWKQFALLWRNLLNMYKLMGNDTPHNNLQRFVSFLNQRMVKATIDNLEFLIRLHLRKTQVDFPIGKALPQTKINSLEKLLALVKETESYLANKEQSVTNSLREQPTVKPSKLESAKETIIPLPPALPKF